MRRWRISAKTLRDWISFASGLAGVAHETLLRDIDRPALLLVFAALMGLPFALGADRSTPPKPGPDSLPPSGDAGPSPPSTSSPSPS